MPYNIDQFATEIKSKHPEYQSWDNSYLAGEVIAKHPEYVSWLDEESRRTATTTKNKVYRQIAGQNFKSAGPDGSILDNSSNPFKLGAAKLESTLQRKEQGQAGVVSTAVNTAGAVAKPAAGILGKIFSPITKVTDVVLNKGAGRLVNLATGNGNKPMQPSESDPLSAIGNPKTRDTVESVLDVANVALTAKALPEAARGVTAGAERVTTARAAAKAGGTDTLAGTITQGKAADIPTTKETLGKLDVSGVKTYKDLHGKLETRVADLSTKVDEAYATDTTTRTLKELKATKTVGGEKVSHNYVSDALNQLEDYYKKTNNVEGTAKIRQLRTKAETEGLMAQAVNDLARLHGAELNGFNANGELASGLTKQGAENTRMGLKQTARDMFGNKAVELADEELARTIRTRDLVNDVAEQVNKLQQRVTERGFGEKIGRLMFQVADKLTGGGLKGFVQSFIPRSAGLKVMNALDLEAALQKNLRLLQKAAEGKTEAQVEQMLQQIVDEGKTKPVPLEKGGTSKQTIVPEPLKPFKVNPKKPVKVNNYQSDYPKYLTPDQINSGTRVLRTRENAGRSIDMRRAVKARG